MRWLLEPALGQAMESLSPAELCAKRARGEGAAPSQYSCPARGARGRFAQSGALRANQQLRDAIRRNALPLFATHSTFALIQEDVEIETMLAEHLAIMILLARDRRAAMRRSKPTYADRSNLTSSG